MLPAKHLGLNLRDLRVFPVSIDLLFSKNTYEQDLIKFINRLYIFILFSLNFKDLFLDKTNVSKLHHRQSYIHPQLKKKDNLLAHKIEKPKTIIQKH